MAQPLLMSATLPGAGHRTGSAGAAPAAAPGPGSPPGPAPPPGRLTLLIDSRLLLGPLGQLSVRELGLLVRLAAYEIIYGTPSTWDPDPVGGFDVYLDETTVGWHMVATALPQPDF